MTFVLGIPKCTGVVNRGVPPSPCLGRSTKGCATGGTALKQCEDNNDHGDSRLQSVCSYVDEIAEKKRGRRYC